MIRTPRRQLLKLATALAASAALPAAAQTAFPSRPIKLIVPHAPGGNADAFGRILAQYLSERVGKLSKAKYGKRLGKAVFKVK